MNQISAERQAQELVKAIARVHTYPEYLSLLQRYDHRCRARLTQQAWGLMSEQERDRLSQLQRQWEQVTSTGVIDL